MKPTAPESMSTKEIVRELGADGALLVERQVALARVELRDELAREVKAGALLAAAAVLAWTGFTLLLFAAALAIGLVLPFWAGALIVGGVVSIGAAVLGAIGWVTRVREALPRTRREAREELEWARSQWKS